MKVGLLTSGGDCQALNATMRGVVKGLAHSVDKLEVFGFKDGYKGLIYSDFVMLTPKDFSGILTRGGTILGTSRQFHLLNFSLMRYNTRLLSTFHYLKNGCFLLKYLPSQYPYQILVL